MTRILIPEEFFLYLEMNGYSPYLSDDKDQLIFTNEERKAVSFKNDRVTFFMYYDGSDDEAPDFKSFADVGGVSQLDLFKFQLLMHCFDVVPMQQFLKRIPREEKISLFETLAGAMRPEKVHY